MSNRDQAIGPRRGKAKLKRIPPTLTVDEKPPRAGHVKFCSECGEPDWCLCEKGKDHEYPVCNECL